MIHDDRLTDPEVHQVEDEPKLPKRVRLFVILGLGAGTWLSILGGLRAVGVL